MGVVRLVLVLLCGCGRIGFEPEGEIVAPCELDDASCGEGAYSMALGEGHSCVIDGGALYCSGRNERGQLGVGTRASSNVFLRVGQDIDWRQLGAGAFSNCAIRKNGTLWCWGDNAQGQLGLGDAVARDEPTQVGADTDWAFVQGGNKFHCALKTEGSLWCAGENLEAELGQGNRTADIKVFTRVGVDVGWTRLALGRAYGCALRNGGELYCWGTNEYGQQFPGADGAVAQVVGVSDYLDFATGYNASFGVHSDRTLWSWGAGDLGQLGVGDTLGRAEPTKVSDDLWSYVDAHVFHSCAIRIDGALVCWGRTIEGQQGSTAGDDQLTPLVVNEERDWAFVECGRFHTCARKRDGSVWCTGENDSGELGIGTNTRPDLFTEVVLSP